MGTRGVYRLAHEGRRYELELVPAGRGAVATLTVDGERADERPAPWPLGAALEHGEERVAVRWWRPGHVLSCRLVLPKPEDEEQRRRERLPFEPPAGAAGTALPRFEYGHPRLFAARHVVAAVLQVLAGLVGVLVVLPRLFAWIPWPDLSLPDWDLPDLPRPDLPDLWDWLPDWDLPDLPGLPGWVQAVIQSWKWWGPILVAVFVATGEVNKRKARRDAAGAGGAPDTPGTPDRPGAPGARRAEPPRREDDAGR